MVCRHAEWNVISVELAAMYGGTKSNFPAINTTAYWSTSASVGDCVVSTLSQSSAYWYVYSVGIHAINIPNHSLTTTTKLVAIAIDPGILQLS